MTVCAKCANDVKRVYDCDHTNFEEYCVECYTELHYYLTEDDDDDGNGNDNKGDNNAN